MDQFSLQINSKYKRTENKIVVPPLIQSDESLEKFQENYLFMLEQNKEKDKLIKNKETEIKKMINSMKENI